MFAFICCVSIHLEISATVRSAPEEHSNRSSDPDTPIRLAGIAPPPTYETALELLRADIKMPRSLGSLKNKIRQRLTDY